MKARTASTRGRAIFAAGSQTEIGTLEPTRHRDAESRGEHASPRPADRTGATPPEPGRDTRLGSTFVVGDVDRTPGTEAMGFAKNRPEDRHASVGWLFGIVIRAEAGLVHGVSSEASAQPLRAGFPIEQGGEVPAPRGVRVNHEPRVFEPQAARREAPTGQVGGPSSTWNLSV